MTELNKRMKKRSGIVVGVMVIGLAITGCAVETKSPGGAASTAAKSPAAVAAGIGTPVRDGKLEFIVTSVDRSAVAGDPTNEFMQETAKGEFVNVYVTVTNIGDEAQAFYSGNQKLIVGGKKFDAASILGVEGDGDNINPGLSVDSVASFDVPPGAVPEAIELHDSAFSGGATVQLR